MVRSGDLNTYLPETPGRSRESVIWLREDVFLRLFQG